jgi:hypothetical protein
MAHPPADVWEYTPRQAAAFLFLGRRRRRREAAMELSIHALAASGDSQAVREQLRKFDDDAPAGL